MPRLSVAWVMLHRVPPDMRILTPASLFFSKSSVRGRARSATGGDQSGRPGADYDDIANLVHGLIA